MNEKPSTAGIMPLKNALCFFLGALIWGTAFVAQSVGGEEIGVFAYVGYRFLMGASVLLPIILYRRKHHKKYDLPPFSACIKGGILSGIALFLASAFQQAGIMHVAVGKSGFMTALYIIIVPILSFLLTKRTKMRVWIAAILGLCGLYCLCMEPNESLTVGLWEGSLILCAFLFAIQIMLIDFFALRSDAIELAFMQFLTAGILGITFAFFQGSLSLQGVGKDAFLSLLYAGFMSSGVAYTLQVIGQKGSDPAIGSLIMSLEAPISAIAGFLILHQELTRLELLGCLLMLIAIFLVQLPQRQRS